MVKTILLVFSVLAVSVPALAQIDLAGHWAARQHEDLVGGGDRRQAMCDDDDRATPGEL